ncbi:TolC family protein [Nitrosospira sp. NpAV]|uniref:TolC family protein n=1 Tax=Nitrosospira sp. NpAV TaxID=58133 RepID=UPI000696EBD9|nr:TolC family protein [Nitrosospira sp. NpAV]
MNFSILFTICRYLMPSGLLILAICCTSVATAGNTFSGALPAGDPDYSLSSLPEEKSDLTLRSAARIALLRNPELAAFAKEIRALKGATLQAGLLPNPDVIIMAENAGNLQKVNNAPGTPIKEVEQQDTTIRINQLIELGGKRAARVKAASLGEELAGQAYETRRVELIAQVANVFTDVLAGQEQLRLAEESQQLAQRVVNTVAKRVQAGKVPPIEETKVEVAFSATEIALVQAQRDLATARKRLALLWGSSAPQFNRALGNLELLVTLPSFEVLAERALASPMALRAIKNIEQRKALLEVEQTRRIPNLTVVAGVLNHSQTGGTTAVAGISIPLQIFDRNQGNLREAHERMDKAMDEQMATELRLKTELTQAYEALSAAQNEIRILRDNILPKARNAFEVTNKGYELGRFGFLEVLDGQRTLFQNQILYVRALANYQRLVNEIERLIAAPIDGVLNPPVINGNAADIDLRSGL